MPKEHLYDHMVMLNETNAMGGVVYFSNFVKWQGMAREHILCSHPKFKELIAQPIEMVTRSCSVKFKEHLYFGDTVQIRVSVSETLPTGLALKFEYYKKGTKIIVAEGEQKIAFIDSRTGQPCRVPQEILELVGSL